MVTKNNRYYNSILFGITFLLFILIYSCNSAGSSDAKKDSATAPADSSSMKMGADTSKMKADTTKKATDTGTKGGQQTPTGH
jgi:hypothetical protein